MTKELSKQLCELCGVNAKFRNRIRYLFETNENYNTRIRNTAFYADIGQPENFVMLQEILCKRGFDIHFWENDSKLITVSLLGGDWSDCGECFERALLKVLIKFLKGVLFTKDRFEHKLKEQFKQSIREAEWKYE